MYTPTRDPHRPRLRYYPFEVGFPLIAGAGEFRQASGRVDRNWHSGRLGRNPKSNGRVGAGPKSGGRIGSRRADPSSSGPVGVLFCARKGQLGVIATPRVLPRIRRGKEVATQTIVF